MGFTAWPSYSGDITGDGLTDLGGAVISGHNVTIEGSKNFILGTPSQQLTGTTTVRGCLFTAQGRNACACAPGVAGDLLIEWTTFRPDNLTDHTVECAGNLGYQFAIAADGTSSSPGTWNGFVDGALVVRNCHFWGFANATKLDGSTQADPWGFYDCVVESPRLNDQGWDDHTDGIGSPSGGAMLYTTIDGCWIVGQSGDTNGLAFQNTYGGTYDHMTVTNNVFAGWGNTIAILQGTYPTIGAPPFLTFEDNVLWCKHRPLLTPVYNSVVATGTGTSWARNKAWVPSDAEWGDPDTQDGLFWLPTSSNISGSGAAALAPFVSATDYAA